MQTMTHEPVFLAFGANLGHREEQIERGIEELGSRGVEMEVCSSWYETEPVGLDDQPWYLNRVARGNTCLEPAELLAACKRVEKQIGRVPSVRFGPRHLDIDILLYGTRHIETETLTVPHPRMHERRFVLIPLLEIAPNAKDPVTNEPYAEILSRLDEGKKVTRSLTNES
jgi:2-amino-4-hydroxy-6-hydroxymethyldihydropteridine diphosphokinase